MAPSCAILKQDVRSTSSLAVAEPLTTWLKQHPGVEVLARDRASAYADAARAGAPNAIQVADRLHLVRNVSDALREVVDRQSWTLPEPTVSSVSADASETVAERPRTRADQKREAAAERLRLRYEEVRRRFENGESNRAISKATGLDRTTVQKYVQSVKVPERAVRRPSPHNMAPFVDYLGDRWRSGCHNARKLFEEIRQLGYTGSSSSVRRILRPWRSTSPESTTNQAKGVGGYVWKEVRWAILSPAEHLKQPQQDCLLQLFALHPKLGLAHELAQRFRQVLRGGEVKGLDDWLTDAAASELAPFERLAKTLTADKSAVIAAVELPWSTGRVEGIITRVKLLKRIGYGRASLPLLRARIIGAC